MFKNAGFKMEIGGPKVKEFWLSHVPDLEEFGFKVGTSFLWFTLLVLNYPFELKTDGFYQ